MAKSSVSDPGNEIHQGSDATITITSPFADRSGLAPLRFSRDAVLRDYRIGVRSRHASVIGRREVIAGRGKFGIFGDGKEVAQLAMAYAFQKGDFRSGYYRDQTFMFALGATTVREFFSQLYAHADLEAEPAFGGRSMTGHFATRSLRTDGTWKDLLDAYNSAADLSPTASQMPRLVGLAYASKLYRNVPKLRQLAQGFSDNGNEVAFGTIGNASCAEGMFWEAINAVGVLQVPMLLSIWDDDYGISVPNEYQMTKGNVSAVLEGFQQREGGRPGLRIYRVAGWDYPSLCTTYYGALEHVRRDHQPAVLHITELTQPLGHSTSGSHERYKPPERLEWEKVHDCLVKMRTWILDSELASDAELDSIEAEEKEKVLAAKDEAWRMYREPLDRERDELIDLAKRAATRAGTEITDRLERLQSVPNALRRHLLAFCSELLVALRTGDADVRRPLIAWKERIEGENAERYGSQIVNESETSVLHVTSVPPAYDADAERVSGFEILNACFDEAFRREPRLVAFGEDIGELGDVNQGFANLQDKYGELRIADTGIRETTIIGQAIGLAMRGLRPIAEIQYLDYVLYALQIMSDDLACLRWRTRGGQKAPVIIRTRGHRLEGIWHSGSPMAALLHLLRGMYICVPRNATQAAAFYNTLLLGDDPALIVEVLNAYRRKAPMPANVAAMRTELGVPEILRSGEDVTVVTYGACCDIVLEAAEQLAEMGVSAEVIDVRTLLPFDRRGMIAESVEKTAKVLFVDEDMPGATSAYMMREVLEVQGAHRWLDSAPRTLTAPPHRPAYGSDGDYFSKPNREQVLETVLEILHENDPRRYPLFFR